MMEVVLDFVQILTVVTVLTISVLIGLFKYNLSYWKRKGVIQIPNPTIPFGNITKLVKQKESLPELTMNTYNFIKSSNAKHGGLYLFGKPVWMPVDLDLLNNVIIKDFSHFVNRGFYINAKDDPLSAHLLALEDDPWKRMRTALTPIFTTGKTKLMFPTMLENARQLEKVIEKSALNKQAIDVNDYFSRFTTDIISSIFLGLKVNSIENPDDDLINKAGMRFFNNTNQALRMLISFIVPRKYLLALKFCFVKPDISDYFIELVRNTIDYRKQNSIQQNDFIQLLMELDGTVEDTGEVEHLTIEEIAAQLFIFYLAGYETSALSATFALLELALNQNIQEKSRDEIRTVLKKYGGELTYDACMEMTYLEQVIKESLRKYPPASTVFRQCTKDYEVPGTDVTIKKDTLLIIPIIGVQRDPDIYTDPETFDPDRFGPNNSNPNIAFLPFGEGPRICIGKKFGMIETKIALATVIKNHRVTVNREKTEIPVVFATKSLMSAPKGGIWLNINSVK